MLNESRVASIYVQAQKERERDLNGISVNLFPVTTHRNLVPELREPNLVEEQVDREMTG